jgi:hypothetical protein
MEIIHIDANNKNGVEKIKDKYNKGHHIFMLIRRDGCPPCEATKPEWLKIKDSSSIQNKNMTIMDVEEQALNELSFMEPPVSIIGYPTMVSVKNKKIKSYDDSTSGKRDKTNGKYRTAESFVDWINEEHTNPLSNPLLEKSSKTNRRRKRMRKTMKGGKRKSKRKRMRKTKRNR